jgi:AraC-like DNA-binding protein
MRYHEIRPSADLAPFVSCFWELEADGNDVGEPIFPDGCVEIVFHLGDRPRRVAEAARQPRLMIVGQMTTAIRLEAAARIHAIGVRFTPAGARAWLASPVRELTGRIEDAAAVLPRPASRLQTAVEDAVTTSDRFGQIETALRTTLRPSAIDRTVMRAVDVVSARHGCVTVDLLANISGMSARQLERRFLEAVGLPPKTFTRIVRFQRALEGLRAGVPPAVAAATAGFADQSHLAREFRRFAGAPARDIDLARVAFIQDAAIPAAAGSSACTRSSL